MKKGFTLIEVLVVISIIGLLFSVVMASISQTNARSRDARREADINELRRILLLYEINTGRYPVCSPEIQINGTSDCLSSAVTGEGLVNVLPKDPRHGVGGGNCGDINSFYYCYDSADGESYTLRYKLETDSILGKIQGWNSVSP